MIVIVSLSIIQYWVIELKPIIYESSPFFVHGSFAVATICIEGILIAAEFRGTIYDNSGKNLTYYDGVQKVFPIGKNAIAYTGTGHETIQNLYFGALVDHFLETHKKEIPLEQLLPVFLDFAEKVLPAEASRQVRSQQLIAAGYVGTQPMACYYNEAQT